jgi:hypothetical protein
LGIYSNLFDFEVAWKRVLERKNRQLTAEGRPTISRFHATYWSTQPEEFKGWSDDEKFEFFDNLLAIFGQDSNGADTVAVKRIDANNIHATSKKDGKVLYTTRLVVSKDGKVMTIASKGINASGQVL